MAQYRWFMAGEATATIARLPARHRRDIFKYIEQIAKFPEQEADREEQLERKDFVKTKRFGQWRITWWVDGPVKEVQIFGFEKVPR